MKKLIIREINLKGGRVGYTIREDKGNGLTLPTNGKVYKTAAKAVAAFNEA